MPSPSPRGRCSSIRPRENPASSTTPTSRSPQAHALPCHRLQTCNVLQDKAQDHRVERRRAHRPGVNQVCAPHVHTPARAPPPVRRALARTEAETQPGLGFGSGRGRRSPPTVRGPLEPGRRASCAHDDDRPSRHSGWSSRLQLTDSQIRGVPACHCSAAGPPSRRRRRCLRAEFQLVSPPVGGPTGTPLR